MEYDLIMSYKDVFHKINKTTLALINACRYEYNDEKGTFTYIAVDYDATSNVFFKKEYK